MKTGLGMYRYCETWMRKQILLWIRSFRCTDGLLLVTCLCPSWNTEVRITLKELIRIFVWKEFLEFWMLRAAELVTIDSWSSSIYYFDETRILLSNGLSNSSPCRRIRSSVVDGPARAADAPTAAAARRRSRYVRGMGREMSIAIVCCWVDS